MWSAVESGANGGGGEAPCSRGKHSATLLGAHVYVLGGRGAGGAVPLRDFWRYSLSGGSWERVPARGEGPPALQEHSATAHGARLYVFGGEAGALSGETPLWIYDTDAQTWRKLAGPSAPVTRRRAPRERAAGPGPRGLRGHSAHALKDCLLIYGGYRDLRGSTHELWAFHYESESWQQVRTARAGPARHRHAAALHDNRLYVHGGQCDLRDCADLWHYDTMSRVWTQVRTPARVSPSARSGHAGLRAGAHLYIFGGEAGGQPTNELWRFHFATETWERIAPSLQWPSPRVDGCALLVPSAPVRARSAPTAPAPRPEPPASLLREISKLSSFHIRRAARCSYSVLGERDSSESLAGGGGGGSGSLAKSHSSYVMGRRQPGDGGESPREADVAERGEPARLVCLDSDEEAGGRRALVRKSASVRFTAGAEDEAELSTSDYASAERVGRPLGFSNPHYLGGEVTPDSGVAGDIELQELGVRREPRQLHVLLVGGKEPPHRALLRSPLSMWTYRLL